MNLCEILVANGTSLFLFFVLVICRHKTKLNRRPVDRIFSVLILIGIIGTVLETTTFLVDGRPGAFFRAVCVAANTLEYFCAATIAVIWVWYVDLNLNHDMGRLKTKFVPMIVIWAVLVILLAGNIFGRFLFSFDENNVYSREPLGYLFFGFLGVSYITSIALYYKFRARHGREQFFPVWMFLLPQFIAIIFQIPFYGISLTFLGCSIGFIGVYMNLMSKQSLVDSLTGLYNRSYIEHGLIVARSNKKYVIAGIMLDIDSFKNINDSFGHSVGDEALEGAAKILMNATDRDSLAFRFAGDEFIVLLRVPVAEADELEVRTLELEERIRVEADKFNKSSGATYDISFSMGHAMFDTKLADDCFFRKMDEEMYKDKQKRRASGQ